MRIVQYQVRHQKVQSAFRVVQLSDLHGHMPERSRSSFLERVRQWNPDLIFVTGDMFEDWERDGELSWIRELASQGPPIYYVTGNHEEKRNDRTKLMRDVRRCGVQVLSFQQKQLAVGDNELQLFGFDDIDTFYFVHGYGHEAIWEEAARNLASHKREDTLSILLSHRPEYQALYRSLGMDVIFSGHAHGGQVRVPYLLNGLYAPGQGLFPRYAGGHYRFGKGHHIISRGMSNFWYLPRIFNPQEIVVVDFLGGSGV